MEDNEAAWCQWTTRDNRLLDICTWTASAADSKAFLGDDKRVDTLIAAMGTEFRVHKTLMDRECEILKQIPNGSPRSILLCPPEDEEDDIFALVEYAYTHKLSSNLVFDPTAKPGNVAELLVRNFALAIKYQAPGFARLLQDEFEFALKHWGFGHHEKPCNIFRALSDTGDDFEPLRNILIKKAVREITETHPDLDKTYSQIFEGHPAFAAELIKAFARRQPIESEHPGTYSVLPDSYYDEDDSDSPFHSSHYLGWAYDGPDAPKTKDRDAEAPFAWNEESINEYDKEIASDTTKDPAVETSLAQRKCKHCHGTPQILSTPASSTVDAAVPPYKPFSNSTNASPIWNAPYLPKAPPDYWSAPYSTTVHDSQLPLRPALHKSNAGSVEQQEPGYVVKPKETWTWSDLAKYNHPNNGW